MITGHVINSRSCRNYIWHYNRANSDAMTRAVTDFHGLSTLEISILPSKLYFSITKFLLLQVILYLTTTPKFSLRILPGLPTTFEV